MTAADFCLDTPGITAERAAHYEPPPLQISSDKNPNRRLKPTQSGRLIHSRGVLSRLNRLVNFNPAQVVSFNPAPTLLGHTTVKMTERYAHLAPENVRTVLARLDGVQSRFGHADEEEGAVAIEQRPQLVELKK